MKRLLLSLATLLTLALPAAAQTGGTAEAQRNMQLFRPPRYATADLPTCGAGVPTARIVYDTTDNVLKFCNGSDWTEIGGGGGSGDISDVWACATGNCSAITAAAGDSLNATAADSTRPHKTGTALPGTCNEGEVFQDTDLDTASELYVCTAANTWYGPLVATTGNTATATALAANGADCAAGNYPLGVDESGAAESCTADDDVPDAGEVDDTALAADSVTEAKLKAVDAAGDEECLTYESTVGDFEWQACGGGSSLPVADTQTLVTGSDDATKILRFEVDGFATATTRVATWPNGNITVAGINLTQTWTATQTLSGAAIIAPNGTNMTFGAANSTLHPSIAANTALTPDSAALRTGTTGNSWHVYESDDQTFDFNNCSAGTSASTSPLFCIHSENQNTAQWIDFKHNGTNAVIDVGTGGLALTFAGTERARVSSTGIAMSSGALGFSSVSAPDAQITRTGTAYLRITGSNTSNPGYLSFARSTEQVLTTKTPNATETNEMYTNEGDGDGATVTLPTAAEGLMFTFCVQTTQTLTITAGAGDTIRVNANVTAAAGSIDSNEVGECITLNAINATEWFATAHVHDGTPGF